MAYDRYMVLFFFPPHGNIHSALRPHPLTAIFGLAASPPHGEIDFLFASRQMSILFFSRRLTAKSIFYSPHGECRFYFSHAPSRRNRFSICLTVNVVLFFSRTLTANIDFLFASRRMSILFFLRPLTVKSILYLPHSICGFYTLLPPRGNISFALHGVVDQFSLRLMARTDFILPTRCFVPHGGNQCSLSLTARLGFIPICA
jgi:hypothetical protein